MKNIRRKFSALDADALAGLLSFLPALACGLWLGDSEFFWLWIAGGAYFLFSMAAYAALKTGGAVYKRLFGADICRRCGGCWLFGAAYFLLWFGFFFQLAMMIF